MDAAKPHSQFETKSFHLPARMYLSSHHVDEKDQLFFH
jgi:hypothetical protein